MSLDIPPMEAKAAQETIAAQSPSCCHKNSEVDCAYVLAGKLMDLEGGWKEMIANQRMKKVGDS